tara:strand:- start:831 stop:1250 length:420 start_codon:yes stop_codon:yes gene_type:complete
VINKDKIFELFDDQVNKKEVAIAIKNQLEGVYGKIGMFTKLILNHMVFHQKLEKFLKKENPSYNVGITKEASSYHVFNRAWQYIKHVDIDNEKHLSSILNFSKAPFKKALDLSLEYFEGVEEYEKCAFLFKLSKIVGAI